MYDGEYCYHDGMIRVQAQLTESQSAALKALARERGTSVAGLLREGADKILAEEGRESRSQRRQRALLALGRFQGTGEPVAAEHDRFLDEIYSHRTG